VKQKQGKFMKKTGEIQKKTGGQLHSGKLREKGSKSCGNYEQMAGEIVAQIAATSQ
jgi:hypothetical protein